MSSSPKNEDRVWFDSCLNAEVINALGSLLRGILEMNWAAETELDLLLVAVGSSLNKLGNGRI